MNYFEYNGVRSSDMGVRIMSKNVFSAPKYDLTFQSIPGRDGDLISPNGRFPNVQLSYTCFVPAKTTLNLVDSITKIKGVALYRTGQIPYAQRQLRHAVFAQGGVQ